MAFARKISSPGRCRDRRALPDRSRRKSFRRSRGWRQLGPRRRPRTPRKPGGASPRSPDQRTEQCKILNFIFFTQISTSANYSKLLRPWFRFLEVSSVWGQVLNETTRVAWNKIIQLKRTVLIKSAPNPKRVNTIFKIPKEGDINFFPRNWSL